jgi:RNA polymerase sigma-70 factor (ECF subfamily)
MDDGDDVQLVGRCLAGDGEAFRPLVERYQRVVFNLALRMLGDPEEARDVAQTAFVKVYENLGRYDPRFRFFSWVYRIALNECLNARDRRRRHAPLDPGLAAGHDHPDDGVRHREVGEQVRGALMRLPRAYREVVVLRHFAELTYAEMSAVLRVPEKTVKSRLHTARQRLGELLLEWRPAR